jgi:alkylation response protein AidB-like acyl-CoA dehydrogenase
VTAPTLLPRIPVDAIAANAGAVDAEGRFPAQSVEALRQSGLLALGIGLEYGGPGGGPVEVVRAIEKVASACGSTAMVYTMHVVAAQTVIAGVNGDGEGPKAQTLREMAAGRHLSTLAYSERGSRSHFWAQVSRAVPADGGVRIDADKSWATSAGHVESYVVACGAPGREEPTATELYLVDAGNPAISIPHAFEGLGMRGNASAPLLIRGLHIGAERRLGDPAEGFELMMTATLPWFALGSAACSVGLAGAALDIVTDHVCAARFDHLGGTSLAELPTVRARLAEARVRHLQARALVYQVARQVADAAPEAELGVMAVKAAAAEMAVEVTDAAMRIGGGAAYSRHLPLERIFRDARAASVMAPTTDVLHDLLGKALTGQPPF